LAHLSVSLVFSFFDPISSRLSRFFSLRSDQRLSANIGGFFLTADGADRTQMVCGPQWPVGHGQTL
jgi:hypothetical protein